MISSGWWEALAYVWVIAILNLTYAAAIALDVHPTAFLLEAFLVGGIALIVIAKPGERAAAIMWAPQTWIYGVATIAGEIVYYAMIVYIPPADASVFMRLNILLTIAIGWLVIGRPIARLRALGMAVVFVGLLVMVYFVPAAQNMAVVAATVVTAVVMAVRNLVAEFHPWNRRAKTVTDKMRVTGLVVLATSGVGLAVIGVLSLGVACGLVPANPVVPPPAQFIALPTIVFSLVMGCVLITVMQYLMFSAVVKITSENFFAVMALVPLATLILQEAAGRVGMIGASPAGWYILPFLLLILFGNVLIVWRGGPVVEEVVSGE